MGLMYYEVMVLPGQVSLPAFVRLVAHDVRWRLLSELARSDLRVRELVALVGQPQNLVSYHLRLLRSGGLVVARRSSFDGRDSYYHLDLDRYAHSLAATGPALHPALQLVPAPPTPVAESAASVLFTCTGNSARSPIAEALLRHRTGGRVEVTSAGSHPKPHLHPEAVRVLREQYGIDLAGRRPRHLDTLTGRRFDHVITLCDRVREACPEFDGHPRHVHWSIADPSAEGAASFERTAAFEQAAAFERTAAEIDTRIRYLLPVLDLEVQP